MISHYLSVINTHRFRATTEFPLSFKQKTDGQSYEGKNMFWHNMDIHRENEQLKLRTNNKKTPTITLMKNNINLRTI